MKGMLEAGLSEHNSYSSQDLQEDLKWMLLCDLPVSCCRSCTQTISVRGSRFSLQLLESRTETFCRASATIPAELPRTPSLCEQALAQVLTFSLRCTSRNLAILASASLSLKPVLGHAPQLEYRILICNSKAGRNE